MRAAGNETVPTPPEERLVLLQEKKRRDTRKQVVCASNQSPEFLKDVLPSHMLVHRPFQLVFRKHSGNGAGHRPIKRPITTPELLLDLLSCECLCRTDRMCHIIIGIICILNPTVFLRGLIIDSPRERCE